MHTYGACSGCFGAAQSDRMKSGGKQGLKGGRQGQENKDGI